MSITKHNDAPAVDQTLEHSAKLLALVVWKLARNGVTITSADIEQFAREGLIMCTIGRSDGFTFSMVTPQRAAEIAAHHKATNEGRG